MMDPQMPVENYQPEPAIVPPPAVPDKPKTNNSFIIILFSILLVLLLVATGFLYYQNINLQKQITSLQSTPTPLPTTDPTADWKTYTFQAYSLKLPVEWSSTTTKNPVQFLNYSPSTTTGRSYDALSDKGKLKVEIYQETTNVTLKEFLSQKKASNIDLKSDTVWQETETKISGVDAVKVKTSNPGFVYYIKDVSNDAVFSIAFGLDFDNYLDLSNQILSTFKFSDLSENTFGLKTYQSSSIGIRFQYPEGWTFAENQKYTKFETFVPSLEKKDGKVLNYSFEVIQEDPLNFAQWSKESTTKILSTKIVNGTSFERYIIPDMYYSLNYIYRSTNGTIVRFMLYPYTADESVTDLDSVISQILSTFKFTN